MAVNLRMKVSFAGPHCAISTLMLITAVIEFVGTLALKYEISIMFGNYMDDYLGKTILFLFAVSILVFADAFLGILSLIRRWYHAMIAFLACTAYLLVTMIIVIAVIYVFSINAEEAMFEKLQEDMKDDTLHSEVVDAIQSQLQCCGYNNIFDWTNTLRNIPQSCCIAGTSCDTTNSSEIYSTGCHEALHSFLCFRKWLILVVLAVIGIIEVISIVLSVTVVRDLARGLSTPEASATNNVEPNSALPRIHNPLAQNQVPPVNNNGMQEPYVRRPSQRPVDLTYRSPHESFLRQPPQWRFDRRIALPSTNHKNPHAARPG